MRDIHSERALTLFGEVTRDTRARAKTIGYLEAYGAGEIAIARRTGQYPRKGIR